MNQPVESGTSMTNQEQGNVTVNEHYGISKEAFAKYAADLGVTDADAELTNFFRILEQNKVDRADLDKKLLEIAETYKKLLENAKSLESSDDPKVKDLSRQARASIEGKDAQGNSVTIDFAKAEILLQQAVEISKVLPSFPRGKGKTEDQHAPGSGECDLEIETGKCVPHAFEITPPQASEIGECIPSIGTGKCVPQLIEVVT